MASNFSNLTFGDSDFSSVPNYNPPLSSVQHLPRHPSNLCTFNCVCCARFYVGKPCWCNSSKESSGTQTHDLHVPNGLNPDNFWKRGTMEHGLLQKTVNSLVDKFQLRGTKNPAFDTAATQCISTFSSDMPQTQLNLQKIRQRLKKAAQWQSFYEKKKKDAREAGKAVRDFIRSKKHLHHDDKENQQLLEDGKIIGVDNRAYEPDYEDSDSDVPLCVIAKKKI